MSYFLCLQKQIFFFLNRLLVLVSHIQIQAPIIMIPEINGLVLDYDDDDDDYYYYYYYYYYCYYLISKKLCCN